MAADVVEIHKEVASHFVITSATANAEVLAVSFRAALD